MRLVKGGTAWRIRERDLTERIWYLIVYSLMNRDHLCDSTYIPFVTTDGRLIALSMETNKSSPAKCICIRPNRATRVGLENGTSDGTDSLGIFHWTSAGPHLSFAGAS